MFKCKRIEERTADGALDALGLEWTEGRPVLSRVQGGIATATLVAGFVVTVAPMFMKSSGNAHFYFGLFILWLGFMLIKLDLPGRRRQLLFCRDGSIVARLGFSYYPAKYWRVTATIDEVKSIEVRQLVKSPDNAFMPYTHGVVLYNRRGDVSYVAGRLEADAAHKVAVQLTHAFNELREDMATSIDAYQRVIPANAARGRHGRKALVD